MKQSSYNHTRESIPKLESQLVIRIRSNQQINWVLCKSKKNIWKNSGQLYEIYRIEIHFAPLFADRNCTVYTPKSYELIVTAWMMAVWCLQLVI